MATIEDKAKALQQSKAEEFASACPSHVIEMALEDLEAVERSQKYVIDMNHWHVPQGDGTCAVCLAGAVMAARLHFPVYQDYTINDFSAEVDHRLVALNDFRCGDVRGGLLCMGIADTLIPHLPMTEYSANPAGFKSEMRVMAEMLKSHGL